MLKVCLEILEGGVMQNREMFWDEPWIYAESQEDQMEFAMQFGEMEPMTVKPTRKETATLLRASAVLFLAAVLIEAIF
jgi:hypothetical protein